MLSSVQIGSPLHYNPKLAGLLNPKPMIVTVYMTVDQCRDVETVGPVSPVGHRYLRSDSNTFLPVQMSGRPLEYLKCYLDDISACTGPTVKYDLWNSIRISQPIHFCIYLGDSGPFYTWNCIQKVCIKYSVRLTKLRMDRNISLSVRMTGTPTRVFNMSAMVRHYALSYGFHTFLNLLKIA